MFNFASSDWHIGTVPACIGVPRTCFILDHYAAGLWFGWLVVFYVPSTMRSFRDDTTIYCSLRRTWSSVNTPFPTGIEPRAVAWQSITLPLRHAISTPGLWNEVLAFNSVPTDPSVCCHNVIPCLSNGTTCCQKKWYLTLIHNTLIWSTCQHDFF